MHKNWRINVDRWMIHRCMFSSKYAPPPLFEDLFKLVRYVVGIGWFLKPWKTTIKLQLKLQLLIFIIKVRREDGVKIVKEVLSFFRIDIYEREKNSPQKIFFCPLFRVPPEKIVIFLIWELKFSISHFLT